MKEVTAGEGRGGGSGALSWESFVILSRSSVERQGLINGTADLGHDSLHDDGVTWVTFLLLLHVRYDQTDATTP